jgi:prepilin-type processing-associated H-X9-DG protein
LAWPCTISRAKTGGFRRASRRKTRFPGSYTPQTGGYEWTYFLHFLLPDLEQEAFYTAIGGPQFNTDLYNNNAAWAAVDKACLGFFWCPSDTISDNGFFDASSYRYVKINYLGLFSGLNDADGAYAATNYAGLTTTAHRLAATTRRAVFRYGEGTPIAEIKDGTSNTMAVVEYLKGIGLQDDRGNGITHRAGCQTLFVTLGPNSTAPDNLLSIWCPNGGAPNEPGMNLPCVGGDSDSNYASPRSRHPGGVNAVFCDGSVHFIDDSVDVTGVWRPLGWIDDGTTTNGGLY